MMLTFPAPISLRNFCFLSSLPKSAASQLLDPSWKRNIIFVFVFGIKVSTEKFKVDL